MDKTDGQTDRQTHMLHSTDRHTDRQVDRLMEDRQTDRQVDRLMEDRQTDRQVDRLMEDRQTDRQVDRLMDGQERWTDRQTHTHTHAALYSYTSSTLLTSLAAVLRAFPVLCDRATCPSSFGRAPRVSSGVGEGEWEERGGDSPLISSIPASLHVWAGKGAREPTSSVCIFPPSPPHSSLLPPFCTFHFTPHSLSHHKASQLTPTASC